MYLVTGIFSQNDKGVTSNMHDTVLAWMRTAVLPTHSVASYILFYMTSSICPNEKVVFKPRLHGCLSKVLTMHMPQTTIFGQKKKCYRSMTKGLA